MKKLLRTVRKVKRELNILLLICFGLYIVTEFWLRRLPPFMGWPEAHRLADLTTNLCLAYVASWIFFFVADHFEKVEDKDTMASYIEGHLNTVLQSYFSVAFKMSKFKVGDNSEAYILFRSDKFYAAIFDRLENPGSMPDEFKGLLFDIHQGLERSLDAIDAILPFKDFLDSRSIMLLLEIKARARYPKTFIENLGDGDKVFKRTVLGYITLNHLPMKELFLGDWNRYCIAIRELADHVRQNGTSGKTGVLEALMERMANFPIWCMRIQQQPFSTKSIATPGSR